MDHRIQTESEIPGDRTYKEDPGDSSRRLRRKRRWQRHIKVLVSEEEVDKRIRELGERISKDYAGKEVHMICVLKGGVFFMCELAKRITVPVCMDFMSVSSYGDGYEVERCGTNCKGSG